MIGFPAVRCPFVSWSQPPKPQIFWIGSNWVELDNADLERLLKLDTTPAMENSGVFMRHLQKSRNRNHVQVAASGFFSQENSAGTFTRFKTTADLEPGCVNLEKKQSELRELCLVMIEIQVQG